MHGAEQLDQRILDDVIDRGGLDQAAGITSADGLAN
jgi:hypothetical protein